MEEKISVIVPIYNVEKYLEECLLSIINQSYKNLEIICVNDGSTDNCAKILEEFAIKDPRIIVLTQKNQGVSVARNNGMRASTGEYIGFVDPDDYISEDFYLELYSILKEHNADIAWANINYVNEQYKVIRTDSFYKLIIYNLADKISLLSNGAVWNKLYRTPILKENCIFFEEGKIMKDNLYLIKSLYWSGVNVTTNKVSYFYRQRLGSITKNNKLIEKKQVDTFYSIVSIMDFAKEQNFDKKALIKLKNFLIRVLIGDSIVKNNSLKLKYINLLGRKYFFIRKILSLKIIKFFYKKTRNLDGSHLIRILKVFKMKV